MNTQDMQQKAVNGSEKSLDVNELWDFNAPEDMWAKTPNKVVAEALGIKELTPKIKEQMEALGCKHSGSKPTRFTYRGEKVNSRWILMPPLRDAAKSQAFVLPADTAAVSVAAEAVSVAVEAVEEFSPKLANGELQQEAVQDAPESPESDEGLEAITAGVTVSVIKWYDPIMDAAKVEAWHERNRQLGAKPAYLREVNPKLVAATRDIEPLPIQERLDLWRATQRAHSAKAAQEVHIHAQVYAMEGLRVFRLARHSKAPLKGSNGFSDGTSDLNVINSWFGDAAYHSNFNIGIATGETDGEFDLCVIDIDKHVDKKTGELIDGFANCERWLSETGLQLPDTLTVRTRSGGKHLYYWIQKGTDIKSNSHILQQYGEKNGVDVRCRRGYVVAPPSYVEDKEDNISGSYKHEVDFPIAHAPADLVAALLAVGAGGSKAAKSPVSFLPSAHEGLITGQDAEDILDTLNYIDPDVGYDDWRDVTALLHNVEGGFEAWEKWSSGGQKWNAEAASKWEQTEGMELAKGANKSKLFAMAAKRPDYVNPSTRRALERKQTIGSNELTNGGLAGEKRAANPVLVDASAKALGELPSVEVFKAWCMAEGAKAYAGDKKNERNKYQFLVSGVLAGDADVVAAYYDGKAFKWDTAVFLAARQAAGYVLTKHQSNKSIGVWSDIDSDGQAKLLNLVGGVFKASPIAKMCVNIAGLGSTDGLSKKVQQGVEDCKVRGGGNSKSPAFVLPSPPSVAPVLGVLGARPAHLGGTGASGGGADYLSAAVGFVGGAAVVDVAPPSGEEWTVKLTAHIAEMNNRHANVLMGGKNRIMRRKVGKLKDHESRYEFIAARELEMLYADTLIQTGWREVRGEKKAIYRDHLNAWLKHKNCRKYIEGVKFEPHPHGTANPCVEGQFNLWAGYAVEPKAGDWSLLDRHISEVMCEDNTELYEYVMNWIAFKIQNPAKLPKAALVCRGKKGSGKGTLGHFLRKVFGEHGLHVINGEQFIGKFNAHLAEKVFVFADEAFFSNDKKHEGVLKALITDDTMMVERKGLDAEQQSNYMAVFMSTNNDYAVPATEDERRYCVLDVSDKYLKDKSYFDPLYAQLDKPETTAAFLHSMLKRNVEGWNPSKIPETKGLQDQRLHSLDSVGKWLVDSIGNGSFASSAEQYMPCVWTETERAKVLIASYVDYCKEHSVSSYDRKTDTALGLTLAKVFGKSRHTREGNIYTVGTLEQAKQVVKDFYKLGDVF